ncbi:putative transcriptional regulatory protein [Escovopsis weberi]|uniref:Putative transcriptional regulatory protein n=1 Tax=Escovopsis weberi TaxID=150374 RepID=A0A0M8N009_ESCWE|nr:putative transcriptional regulatory protein [Escovopsis weberi]
MSPVPDSASALGIERQPRILACVLCQHRKIKCDRKSPCAHCVKAKVTCTPSTPAPTRKRRRPNQDLQERLARCEELLKQYASGPMSLSGEPPKKRAASVTSAPATTPPSSATLTNGSTGGDTAPSTAPPESKQSLKKPGTIAVGDDGNVRFMDSYVFASVYDELQKMRDIVETDDHEDTSILGGEETTPDSNADLLLGDFSKASLEDLQPEAVHIVKLWSVFVERVNPLVKIIHTPTMQPVILEAATGMASMPLNSQALLFSIFAAAVIALTTSECVQILGISRNAALHRFNAGTRSALIKSNYMKNHNMTVLQALALYFFTLEGRYDRHATWILSGTIMRIAYKMGYHRDGGLLNLLPFETEMRRRIWWHILVQDGKSALLSGLSTGGVTQYWDTKRPLNVNDSDLSPDSTWPVKEREGPTEMVFCIVLYELFRFKLDHDQDDDCNVFEAAVMGADPNAEAESSKEMKGLFEKFSKRAQEIEERLQELDDKIIDVKAGKVHLAARSLRSMLLYKSKEILGPLREQPEYGTEIFTPKDKFFKVLVMTFEHKVSCHEGMARAGFQWFMKYNLQLDMLAVFTSFLLDRPMGSLSDRAWVCMTKVYTNHEEIYDMSLKQHVAQAQLTLRAWRAREEAFARVGRPLAVPAFIPQLRELVPSQDLRMSIQSTLASPATTSQPQQSPTGLDQLFGDILNPSMMGMDVFGDLWVNNGNQLSSALFDGFYMGNGKNVAGSHGLPL